MPAGNDGAEAENHQAEYERYDRCVDIVSAVEVWFTKVEGMHETVAHFERYPTITGEIAATPDFTTLFTDDTAYVGELANLSLQQGSLDSLCEQLGRYDRLDRVPGPGGELVEVAAVAGGGQNERPRGHGRRPSLEEWMSSPMSPDTLTGLPKHFKEIKVARRFMNDPTPPLYMATLLWGAVLPSMSGGEGDIATSATGLAERLRHDYGRGRASEVARALELLRVAGLATREGEEGWVIAHQSISRHDEDLAVTLINRYKSRPSGPVTFAAKERAQNARDEREANKKLQTDLEE